VRKATDDNIVICGLSVCLYNYCCTLSHKRVPKDVLTMKVVCGLFSTIFLFLGRIEQYVINVRRSSFKVPVILVIF
jgi:hypothetical protein